MYIDAEIKGPQWSNLNDPRITVLGKFLRKSRIDELPQIINIFFFEINLIGPRAERPEMRDKILKNIPNFDERLYIKPGITGLAQVSSGYQNNISGMQNKLNEDLYYIKNRSISLDIKILYKTIISIIKLIGI
jgi:lipopolysaccharide/colanic/teichoic acid biosynthesis glycosyltransferase